MSVTHPIPQHEATQSQQTFCRDIEVALRSYLPSGQKPYRRVLVLLVSWSNAAGNEDEIDALQEVFRKIYNFETERFHIPLSVSAKNDLIYKLFNMLPALDKKNDLLIFYYGGHATHELDKNRDDGTNRSCFIHSDPYHRRAFADTASGSTPLRTVHINFSEIMKYYIDVHQSSDILYIMDCCYASSVAIEGTKELLAACAIDRTTPGAGHPGSFIRVLVETLERANGNQFTIAQLHGMMTRAYYQNELTTTPVHVELSAEMVARGSIVLAPLTNGSTAVAPHQRVPRPFGTPNLNPKVLISVHLSDVKSSPNAQQWIQWLSSHLPSGIEEIQVELVGSYQAASSILLVLLPVEVWTVLRGDPAYVFVSIVTSGNENTGFFEEGGGLAIRSRRAENIPPGRGNVGVVQRRWRTLSGAVRT